MLTQLMKTISVMLVALPFTVAATETCLGELYSYREAQPEITPPTITIVPQGSQQLKAGELLPLSTEIVSQGQANLVWCAEMGQLLKNSEDLSLVNYQAPFNILEDQVITLGVNADDYGYVGGDNILVYLLKSSSAQAYIVVGTAQGNVLVFSPQGELKATIASNGDTHTIATFDADNDQADEIVIANDSTLYELNGEISTASLPGEDVFILKEDTNGDGNLEIIMGSSTADEVTVGSDTFKVFEISTLDTTSNTRRARKKESTPAAQKQNAASSKPATAAASQSNSTPSNSTTANTPISSVPTTANGNDKNADKGKIAICHKGKNTLYLPESAIEAQLKQPGSYLGECSSSSNTMTGDNDTNNVVSNDNDTVAPTNGNSADDDKKVTICHVSEDNLEQQNTITISRNALEDHLGHGDYLGVCVNDDKVTFCHEGSTINVSESSAAEHRAHGDVEGACPNTLIHGVNVGAGDLTGNDIAEVVAAMASQGSRVETYAGNQRINQFDAFENNNGVLVAVGPVMGNETADIVAAEVNGQEIRIFTGDGGQQGSFAITENIVSLAIARGYSAQTDNIVVNKLPDETTGTTEFTDNTETSEVDKTVEPETQRVISAPTCQVSTTLNSTCGGQNQTVTDGTVESEASVSKLVFEGDTTNEGLVSNSTISEGSTLTGGKLTGYINNQGTLKDIIFSGAEIIGGLLAGTITVERPRGWQYRSLGVLRDVSFASDTVIINAILVGKVSGRPNSPAKIKGGKVKARSILSYVIVSATTEIEEGVVMGEGVILND